MDRLPGSDEMDRERLRMDNCRIDSSSLRELNYGHSVTNVPVIAIMLLIEVTSENSFIAVDIITKYNLYQCTAIVTIVAILQPNTLFSNDPLT